jgi:hypothetical protein
MIETRQTGEPEHFYFTEDRLAYRLEYDPKLKVMVRTDHLPPRPERPEWPVGHKTVMLEGGPHGDQAWSVRGDASDMVVWDTGDYWHAYRAAGETLVPGVEAWEYAGRFEVPPDGPGRLVARPSGDVVRIERS